MRKTLLALPLALIFAQGAFGQCRDTTVVITASPYNPASLNTAIDQCADSTMTITLENSTNNDTVRFSNEIVVTSRPAGAVTHIRGKGRDGGTFIVTENNTSDPNLFDIRVNDKGLLSNFTFVRRAIKSANHTVIVSSKGSIVRDCHFFTADKDSAETGALLFINIDEVLVERCLFRALPNGKGRSIAISAGSPGAATAANRNEYRSNIFYSTGLYLTNGSFHIYANTFAGSRDNYNAIIIGSGVADPGKNVNIQHNLFALKNDDMPPIYFASGTTSSDSIQKNAWSRPRTTVALAVNTSGTAISLPTATNANANTPLPRGFSKYNAAAGDFKEYPLIQLRSDSTLSRSHADFGKIPRLYNNAVTAWTGMPDISSGIPSSKLYFPGSPFTPFLQGGVWNSGAGVGIKVGALIDVDNRIPPSPLDSGTIGTALKYTVLSDSIRIKLNTIAYNTAYYDTLVPPQNVQFFFSNSQAKLMSNDTNVLKNPATGAEAYLPARSWLSNFDSIVAIPAEVRTGNTIYMKMLHFNGSGQAAVHQSATVPGATASIGNILRYPANDLAKPALDPASNPAGGLFIISVNKVGGESIKSIKVTVQRASGGTETSQIKPAPAKGANATFNFDLPKGQFLFIAEPVATIGTTEVIGSPTAALGPLDSRFVVGDTVYVTKKAGGCPGGTGHVGTPYCTLAEALVDIGTKKGGTILVRNDATPAAFQDDSVAGTDTFAVTITVPTASGAFDPVHRAVFRGSAGKEALRITRRNVTLKGFYIEMPPGATAPALTVGSNAGGTVVDGCLFRTSTNSGPAGAPAVNIEVSGNLETRLVNSIIWGYGTAVQINSASNGIRILHNTFMDDASITPAGMTGISAPGAGLNAVIANNYFSGVARPYDANVAGKTPRLDRNAYTVSAPQLQGLAEIGSLDSVPRLASVDLTKPSWSTDLKPQMENVTDCSAFKQCFELYAGSSNDSYGPAITTDVLGKPRIGKPEVGAWEAAASSDVRGVLAIDVRTLNINAPDAHRKLTFTLTRRTFDPAEVDSVYVWWAPTSGVKLDGNILAANQRRYSVSQLGSGTLQDTAIGLTALTTYYFSAAYGKTTAGERKLGWAYTGQGTTPPEIKKDDCVFSGGTVCPATGFFVVSSGPPEGKYQTRFTFSQADSGVVKLPEFSYNPAPVMYANGKVEIFSPMPNIKLGVDAAQTKVSGHKQTWTASIRLLDGDPSGSITGKELFILPADPATGLPELVSTWRIRRDTIGFWLDIEGSRSGTFLYGFGNLVAGAEAGKVVSAPATPPVFSFRSFPNPQDVDSVAVTFRGSGFATANPLVIITPIPAGSTLANPLDGKYPNKSVILTNGFADVDESIRNDRLLRQFQKAVAADSATPNTPGQPLKPFALSFADTGAFEASTVMPATNLAVSGSGDVLEATVRLPIASRYRDQINYPADGKGKATRSLEVVYTILDGTRISRSSGYIRTEFTDATIQSTEKREFTPNVWNLFAYPWDEADTGSLARIVEQGKWDKNDRRLMKYKGTGAGAAAFIAYDGSNQAGITYDSGRAVWSGSIGHYEPDCYSGMSLDYKPFSMTFAPGQWSDFGLPFNFPIKWKDILAASPAASASAQVWRYIPEADKTPAGWQALDGKSVVHPWEGLTVFPKSAPLELTFPILDSSRSSTVLAKASAGIAWSAQVRAWNPTARMDLRIGRGSSEATVGEAPNVPGQDFRVGLKRLRLEGSETLSQHIQAGEDWRGHWPLTGSLSKGGVSLAVSENDGETPLYLVELLARRVIPLAKGSDPVTLSPEDMQGGDWHLVAGDSKYLEDVLDGLVPVHMLALSNSPNPFTGSTLVRYALPESFGRVEFRLKLRDSRGRLVLEKVQKGSNSLRWNWDGRDARGKEMGSGFYTLTLEAVAPGKKTQRAVRRLLKM